MSSKEGSTKGGRGKPKSSKSVSRSSKVRLQFLVGRIARFLKNGKYAQRVGAGAPVYLSSILEYLAAEVVVSTKSPRSDKQYIWEAAAESSSYVIREEIDPEKILCRGTQITLILKLDDKYEFSESTRIPNLVKNYSYSLFILYILLCGVPPFWAESDSGIFRQILKGKLDFESDPWPQISESAKDLIRKMLDRSPRQRITAHEVLCHPWIMDDRVAPDKPLDSAVLTRLKQFSALNKLKKMALRTGKLLNESDKETGHKKTITSLAKSADGSHFLTGCLDKSAKLWDIRSLELIKTYKTERPVNAVTLSPLLNHVVLGGGQDASAVTTTDHRAGKFEAKFYEKILEEEIGGVKGHFGPINALAFNPDGKRHMRSIWRPIEEATEDHTVTMILFIKLVFFFSILLVDACSVYLVYFVDVCTT